MAQEGNVMDREKTNEEQLRRFQEAARELECDDDPERFAERVRKIAKAPPVHKPKKAGKEAMDD